VLIGAFLLGLVDLRSAIRKTFERASAIRYALGQRTLQHCA
jgi:hypothetical protein